MEQPNKGGQTDDTDQKLKEILAFEPIVVQQSDFLRIALPGCLLSTRIDDSDPKKKVLWIQHFSVRPSTLQGRGIGTRMFQILLEEARKLGIKVITGNIRTVGGLKTRARIFGEDNMTFFEKNDEWEKGERINKSYAQILQEAENLEKETGGHESIDVYVDSEVGNPSQQLPASASEQLENLPSFEERKNVLALLFEEIKILLSENGILVNAENSTYRVKTDERIQEKIAQRGPAKPIMDLYGIRFVLDGALKQKAAKIIMENFPTPKVFPWKTPSYRNYSDENERKSFPQIISSYTAIHVNILFGSSQIANIAEIQLMTLEELQRAKETWPAYIKAQKEKAPNKI